MFYLTARIGSMCAVYDDSDNTVEWCDKEVLKKYLSMGISIEGISNGVGKPVDNVRCNFKSCNWTKSKRNIFDVLERAQITNAGIVVFAEGKKYKGKFINKTNEGVLTAFSNGISVVIPLYWLEANK